MSEFVWPNSGPLVFECPCTTAPSFGEWWEVDFCVLWGCFCVQWAGGEMVYYCVLVCSPLSLSSERLGEKSEGCCSLLSNYVLLVGAGRG